MTARFARFGEFELDSEGFELRRRGSVVRMEGLPLRLLTFLVARKGELVTRCEIERKLWGEGVFVDVEQGINTAIRKIRIALRDRPERPRFLQTIVGQGYRFLAHRVMESDTSSAPATKYDSQPMVTMEELGQAVLAAAGLSGSPLPSPAFAGDSDAEVDKGN